ncbi:delta(3,5)-Delta(2,4)-dienoyl-CoA isomerase, mitochondrial-like isoform X2 [Dysidea avara]|uniref:delta(3,5)-Delta(2,4)-dienoyl-CoA isomerase, mitochondrial-like isoform X2 n=1 Tax=Dysidea avara TaxID=196820 RepID=UPI0033325166
MVITTRSSGAYYGMARYQTLAVEQAQDNAHVFKVTINRPEKSNAMNKTFWRESVECFTELHNNPDCRAIVLSGAGKNFSAGLDLTDAGDVFGATSGEVGRNALKLKKLIQDYQESFSVIERCRVPVIAAVHGACVGGGVDMTSACDIRLCCHDTWFQIKEIDLGMAADVGTLQRFPKVIGNDSLSRELALTGRKFDGKEALEMGYVSRLYPNKEELFSAAMAMATLIASKSPIAIATTKYNMVYSRDHTVEESLNHMALWNMAMLQSEDLTTAVQAMIEKKKPTFSKL